MRLLETKERPIITYGGIGEGNGPQTQKYPARQTREASQAIARLHGLSPNHTFFVQQNPDVIDQGVFHNDVIAVGNLNCLLYHEHAYLDEQSLVNKIHSFFSDSPHYLIRVPNHKVSVTHAIQSYLFNSQLISLRPEQMILVVPEECRQIENVWDYLNELSSSPDNPIIEIKVFDVKQSMKNGGGPACLRLRVVLNEDELKAVNPHTLLNDTLYSQLVKWVNKHYRESLEVEDLGDPLLHQECQTALDELSQILRLGSVYDFQGS
jgi:succinylarginine dihydrolase